ncbi:hypothetical protein G6F40_016236 [Rhizopus arrhizus]|nr:hypothetical protein G6F40_016236 [Rhizopus arrhizus]
MTKASPEEARTALINDIARDRLGSPEDIAHAVAFLAGPAAGYITGETLHVNGGMYMPTRQENRRRTAWRQGRRSHQQRIVRR